MESGDEEDWTVFKNLRNSINNRLKYEEKKWQKDRLRQCSSDTKQCWKTLKSILNWKTSQAPTKLYYNGEMETKPKEVADCQNKFLISKTV